MACALGCSAQHRRQTKALLYVELDTIPVAGDGECELVTVYGQTHYVIPSKMHEFQVTTIESGSRSP